MRYLGAVHRNLTLTLRLLQIRVAHCLRSVLAMLAVWALRIIIRVIVLAMVLALATTQQQRPLVHGGDGGKDLVTQWLGWVYGIVLVPVCWLGHGAIASPFAQWGGGEHRDGRRGLTRLAEARVARPDRRRAMHDRRNVRKAWIRRVCSVRWPRCPWCGGTVMRRDRQRNGRRLAM